MHVIRLHAAWEQASANQFRRRFNTPTGITEGSLIWLACESLAGVLKMALNGEPLSLESGVRWDVGPRLRAMRGNLLEITTTDFDKPVAIHSMRLEIEECDGTK